MRSRLLKTLVALVCVLVLLPVTALAADLAPSVPMSADVVATPVEVDYRTNADIEVSADADASLMNDSPYGISSFSRSNKGTSKLYSNVSYGYRYPIAGRDAFAVIDTSTCVIVYIPQQVLQELDLSIDDGGFQKTFLAMLAAVDATAANGGPQFSKENKPFFFTTAEAIECNGYVYGFGIEVEEGYYYVTIYSPTSDDASSGGIYAMSGRLTTAEDTNLAGAATGLAALGEFFAKLDWSPLWVSLRTTGVGMLIVFVLGLLAAWGTVKISDRWKGILDTVFTIPMVLPPTVCGFLLLLLFGNSTPVGRWFISVGIDLVFTWPAAVIACIVVAFPLMYRSARGAFEQLEPTMLDAARTLGWKERRIFLRLMIPLAWPSIASGTVLAFARAIGEFGATLFFAGNYGGITQTIPLAIYYDWMGGQNDVALFWVIVVIIISFLVILFINLYSGRSQRYRANRDNDKVGEDQ